MAKMRISKKLELIDEIIKKGESIHLNDPEITKCTLMPPRVSEFIGELENFIAFFWGKDHRFMLQVKAARNIQLTNLQERYAGKVIAELALGIVIPVAWNVRHILMLEFYAEDDGFVSEVESSSANAANTLIAFDPIFGPPEHGEQFLCDAFMIMPFDEKYKTIYKKHVCKVIQQSGLVIKRADDFFSRNDILNNIWSGLYHCKFVIADCSDRNPNVFYELGIAHTLGKTVILLAQDINDIPFDIRLRRIIVYSDNAKGIAILEEQLTEAIKSIDTLQSLVS